MEREIVVPYDDFVRMAAAEEKLTMLIDSLMNNADLVPFASMLKIEPYAFRAIMMTFGPEEYKNAVEWLKKKAVV